MCKLGIPVIAAETRHKFIELSSNDSWLGTTEVSDPRNCRNRYSIVDPLESWQQVNKFIKMMGKKLEQTFNSFLQYFYSPISVCAK